jgi:hypothetical protein
MKLCWDRFFYGSFGSPVSVSFHRRTILIHVSSKERKTSPLAPAVHYDSLTMELVMKQGPFQKLMAVQYIRSLLRNPLLTCVLHCIPVQLTPRARHLITIPSDQFSLFIIFPPTHASATYSLISEVTTKFCMRF